MLKQEKCSFQHVWDGSFYNYSIFVCDTVNAACGHAIKVVFLQSSIKEFRALAMNKCGWHAALLD